MDGVRSVLEIIRDNNLAKGRLRGVLHLLIGKTLVNDVGNVLSDGLTWRQLASELRAIRFDKKLAAEVGADPETLYPRDRERFWYAVIGLANVGSAEADSQAEHVEKSLKSHGIIVVTSEELKKSKK